VAGGFQANTRQTWVQLADIARPTGGGLTVTNLPKAEILASILLAVRGTIGGTVGTVNALGFAAALNRVRVSANNGIDLFNCGGPMYHYGLRECLESEYGDPSGQSNARSAVTATAANLDMIIPIAINMRDPIGLVSLQSDQLQLTLTIDWLADAGLTSTGTFSNWVATPYLELFTVPPQRQDNPDYSLFHVFLEDQQQVAGAGDYIYSPLRAGLYLQLIHGLGWGAAGTDAFTAYKLRINQLNYLRSTDVKLLDLECRRMRNRARVAGAIPIDFLASDGLGVYGSQRDALNSLMLTNLESIPTATGAGTLFTGRRMLIAAPAA
jgi:hypothetical protein